MKIFRCSSRARRALLWDLSPLMPPRDEPDPQRLEAWRQAARKTMTDLLRHNSKYFEPVEFEWHDEFGIPVEDPQ